MAEYDKEKVFWIPIGAKTLGTILAGVLVLAGGEYVGNAGTDNVFIETFSSTDFRYFHDGEYSRLYNQVDVLKGEVGTLKEQRKADHELIKDCMSRTGL